MTMTVVAVPAPNHPPARRAATLAAVGFGLMTLVVALVAILASRPPTTPQLTAIGTNDGLHLLLEGAGGGRVLIGGGANGSELPAALGRQLMPWRGDLDLLIVADPRDLLGATELVRRGRARAILLAGLDSDRAAAPAIAALRASCDEHGVSVRSLVASERIGVGRGEGLTIDLIPGVAADDPPRLRIAAGTFSAAVVLGEPPADPALAAIVLRGSQERYGAALEGQPRLLIAPGAPADPAVEYLLAVGPGQRATLAIDGASLRLRGGTLTTVDTTRAAR